MNDDIINWSMALAATTKRTREPARHEQASKLLNMPLEVTEICARSMLDHQLVRIDAVSLSPSSTLRCSSSDCTHRECKQTTTQDELKQPERKQQSMATTRTPGLWRFLQTQ